MSFYKNNSIVLIINDCDDIKEKDKIIQILNSNKSINEIIFKLISLLTLKTEFKSIYIKDDLTKIYLDFVKGNLRTYKKENSEYEISIYQDINKKISINYLSKIYAQKENAILHETQIKFELEFLDKVLKRLVKINDNQCLEEINLSLKKNQISS